ncbi:MAG: hypothetical protein JXB48_08395 [Candidatus Latescibacteria bacterium]|nr:hypothetical protein [Candidatus Latescibacterota bacterium]
MQGFFAGKILPALVIFNLCGTLHLKAQESAESSGLRHIEIEHYNFSSVDKDAQMWSAMYIASNNRIYIGLCTHADATNVYEFDIGSKEMRHLANLTILLNERGRGIWTNGKIHVRMQELDGYVYFGSFCEDNGPPAIDAASYNGPWWFKIEIATGRVEPISRINSFWGLLGQVMDKERRIIYGLAENGHLYRYFIDRDYTEDMGRVDNWDICRTLLIDDLGNVYGSYPPGQIWKYDVVQDRIFDLHYLQLPVINVTRSMANPMLDRKTQWRVIEWDPVDKVAYGIIGGSNLLFRYDVHASKEGEIEPLVSMCAPQYRDGDPFDIPHATLAMTISQKERKIYYIPVVSGDFDYGAVKLITAGKSKSNNRSSGPPLSYMVSYDLKTGTCDDLGLLRTADGRYALGQGGACTDGEGRIWFVGAFEEPEEKFVVRTLGNTPYSMGLGCYDPFKTNERAQAER